MSAVVDVLEEVRSRPRLCGRCGAELPTGRIGRRRPRFCRDRRACLLASEGVVAKVTPKLADEQVLERLPRERARARQLRDVAADFSEHSPEQVRRVLARLVHRGHARSTEAPVSRPQGGRAPKRYWRAA